jgi:hypothetical protein
MGMGIAYVCKALAVGVPLLLSLSLGGCATSTAGSSLMDARAEAPASAPSQPNIYLPVGDLPPDRDMPVMTSDERAKLQKELIAARDRQAVVVKAQGATPAEPGKAP